MQIKSMNKKAKMELNFPQSNKLGTSRNSSMFIVAMITIWVIAFSLDLMLLIIQIAITISDIPMAMVKNLAYSFPNMLATIWRCRGTRLSTLQNKPFASQTAAIR
jgi:hypothetical protein